jgi:hypothetical protein
VLREWIIETREVSPDDCATRAESQDQADYGSRIGRKEGRKAQTTHNEVVIRAVRQRDATLPCSEAASESMRLS